jgi:hypothetical protein
VAVPCQPLASNQGENAPRFSAFAVPLSCAKPQSVNIPAQAGTFWYSVSIENPSPERLYIMAPKPKARVGIKNEDGSIRFVFCDETTLPYHILPTLLSHYNSEEKVRALIEKGRFKAIKPDINDIEFKNGNRKARPEVFFFMSYAAMEHYFKEYEKKLSLLYIWAEGEWTCAKVDKDDGDIIPFCVDIVKGTAWHERDALYYKQDWLDKYFSDKPAEPIVRAVVNRLSKEEWLKQNYPGMTELPKWRFPAVAA